MIGDLSWARPETVEAITAAPPEKKIDRKGCVDAAKRATDELTTYSAVKQLFRLVF